MSQRVLVVDDSATVRRVVGRTLSQAGYEVRLATDGRDGLDVVQREVPDLVLVDFVMPRMNGLTFVQSMRQIANLAAVPVVLMSAKADKIGDGFVAQTGAVDAITKPFSPEALLAVTEHALTKAQRAETRDTERPPPRDRISVITIEEPLSESSPNQLAAAALHIAEQLAAVLAPLDPEADAEAWTDRLLAAHEPLKLFDVVDRLASAVPGREGEIAFEGRLEHVGLGEVLQLLTHQRQTGALEIEKQPSKSGRAVAVYLKDGQVELALGRVEEQEFRLGRYLRREGLIDREDLERIVKGRRSERGPARGLLGTQLVKLGYISAEELRRVLVAQTSELIYEALRWPRGRYRFVRFASRPEADDAHLGLPLASILMEGLRRVDEWRLIEEQIASFDDVPRRDEEAIRALDAEHLSGDERAMLERVDGQRSVRDLIELSQMGSFEACKILFTMLTSRLLRS